MSPYEFVGVDIAKDKNDTIDAKIIAQFGQCMELRLYQPSSLEQKN